MKILVVNGPNLNMLGKRDKSVYGGKSLAKINAILKKEGQSLGAEIVSFQSNGEGEIIDFLQENYIGANGIIINPGALTHYGLSLRDALVDTKLPVIEVHLSNIYAREDWRANSVIAPIVKGQISGFGWRGYVTALQILIAEQKGDKWE
jgi:3-dehydroquinate dehydratase II